MSTVTVHHTEQQDFPADVDRKKKSILIYSSDLGFCFSLSMLFEDRFEVMATTDQKILETSAHCDADIVIIDSKPTCELMNRLDEMKRARQNLPIIMLYVFDPSIALLDGVIRSRLDSVFYKPLDLPALSRHIDELAHS